MQKIAEQYKKRGWQSTSTGGEIIRYYRDELRHKQRRMARNS